MFNIHMPYSNTNIRASEFRQITYCGLKYVLPVILYLSLLGLLNVFAYE